mmetsp:Transcript_50300/g.73498  ORF Transcript_50300/g.73498 Transcript_50300/m.73498 type:complete len:80 (+) Transcript_50300:185-424(+)
MYMKPKSDVIFCYVQLLLVYYYEVATPLFLFSCCGNLAAAVLPLVEEIRLGEEDDETRWNFSVTGVFLAAFSTFLKKDR